MRREVEGDVEVDLSVDWGKCNSGGSSFHGSVVGAGSDRRMVIGGGAEGSLDENAVDTFMQDGSCSREKEVVSSHVTSSVQADPGFKGNAPVGEDGMEFEDEGGVDVPSQ